MKISYRAVDFSKGGRFNGCEWKGKAVGGIVRTYSSREAAEQIGVSYQHLRALLAKADENGAPVPSNRAGTSYVWLANEIAAFKKWLAKQPKRGRPKKQ